MLAYGLLPKTIDDYLPISETTGPQTLKCFCRTVIETLVATYFRSPTFNDIEKIFTELEKRGTPGLLRIIHFCKTICKNFPTGGHGQLIKMKNAPTLTLKTILDIFLWIWHAFL